MLFRSYTDPKSHNTNHLKTITEYVPAAYSQEEEENNCNANNTKKAINYYHQEKEPKGTCLVTNPKLPHYQPQKRKHCDYDTSDCSSVCVQKIPRCNTYSRLTTDIGGSTCQTTEKRRCTSIPHSYSEIDEFYMNNASQLLPTIRCQFCHRILNRDTIFMGADMTYCSVHCRQKSLNSLMKNQQQRK